jgi:hypothetical protein
MWLAMCMVPSPSRRSLGCYRVHNSFVTEGRATQRRVTASRFADLARPRHVFAPIIPQRLQVIGQSRDGVPTEYQATFLLVVAFPGIDPNQ